MTHDTAQFAVQAIRRWWETMGQARYPGARTLMITADGSGSNGARVRLWKVELQKLADELGLTIQVRHYPPGTSKWNKIEHRLFCHISQNWRARPLTSRLAVVELIAATTTKTGLTVACELDTTEYAKGIKVPDAEMNTLAITRNDFHPERKIMHLFWRESLPRPAVPGYSRTRRPAPRPTALGWRRPWPSCARATCWWSGSWIVSAARCHLIETVTALEGRGVGFRSLTETIDTTTPGGRLIFHIFGALGQFERDLIRVRTRAGLDAAVARGRRGGRKPVVTEEKLRRARTLIAQGLTVREAAARIKVGKTALYAALGEASEDASELST